MEDFEFFPDEEEEAVEEEGSNRTFIILVAVLGGLLAVGICAFAIWAVVISPRRTDRVAENHSIQTSNAQVAQTVEPLPIDEGAEETAISEATEEAAEPTERATTAATEEAAPTEQPSAETATPAQVAEGASPTDESTATLQPTATRRATITARPEGAESTSTSGGTAGSEDLPSTGIGAFGAAALAAGLLFLLLVVRRLRRTA